MGLLVSGKWQECLLFEVEVLIQVKRGAALCDKKTCVTCTIGQVANTRNGYKASGACQRETPKTPFFNALFIVKETELGKTTRDRTGKEEKKFPTTV